MATVTFDHLTKRYSADVVAVNDLNLEVSDGEFLVLVGPSGCGKTTALRMVAGLEEISEGQLRIGDRVVNDVPPKDRDIAMVFQILCAVPAHERLRQPGLRAEAAQDAEGRDRAPRRRRSRHPGPRASCSTASRRRSPAASASAWRWAGPSSASRRSS